MLSVLRPGCSTTARMASAIRQPLVGGGGGGGGSGTLSAQVEPARFYVLALFFVLMANQCLFCEPASHVCPDQRAAAHARRHRRALLLLPPPLRFSATHNRVHVLG